MKQTINQKDPETVPAAVTSQKQDAANLNNLSR